MNIIVIGAGISGMMTALTLRQAGCQVTLLDKGQPGHEASWAGGGILSPLYPWRYGKEVLALTQHARHSYLHLQQQLLETTGQDIEVTTSGMLMPELPDIDQALDWHATQPDNPAYRLPANGDVKHSSKQSHLPRFKPLSVAAALNAQEALWAPATAQVRNPRLLKAMQAELMRCGVTVIAHTAIEHWTLSADRITSVVDQHGNSWQADQFVLCAGAWSDLLIRMTGVTLPIRPIKGQMLRFEGPADWLTCMLMRGITYLIPRCDGQIICGSTLEDTGFDAAITERARQSLYSQALELVPELHTLRLAQQWAGLRPASPAGIPTIGRSPRHNNLWINAGHFRNGLVMAPAAAQLLRQQLLGEMPLCDPAPYQPAETFAPQSAS